MADPSQTERLDAAFAGRYRILRRLGEGGMATVFLAEDVKHERQVAIKVLKPELAAVIGGERFVTEIRTTANLQHPNILALYDSGEADSFLYYVMPYIEGESLRDRIDREKQLGVDDALRLAREVADALDYAHRNNVIHRDVKPENILLHDGRPVVADFGIALAISAAGGGRMTETGLSLGTPHYMSPEQATADRDLSARSDVYSLGCVVYEMLTGDPPHTGPTAQSVLMRILTEVPRPVTEVRTSVPPHVASAIAKSLEKLRADRFESAAAFRDALGDTGFTHVARVPTTMQTGQTAEAPPPATSSRLRTGVPWAIAAAFALAFFAAPLLEPDMPASPTARVGIGDFPGALAIVPFGQHLAIRSDGSAIVVTGFDSTGVAGLFERRLDEPRFRRVLEYGGLHPTYSPDGQWIVYSRPDAIEKVSLAGGSPFRLAPQSGEPHWGIQETIVFAGQGGIYSIPEAGGEATLEIPDSEEYGAVGRPFMLPNGEGILFEARAPDTGEHAVWVRDRGTGEATRVAAGSSPRYVSAGYLLMSDAAGQTIFAVPFDLDRLEASGTPAPVLNNVTVFSGGATQLAVSENGTLVHASPTAGSGSTAGLAWVDLEGAIEPIPILAEGQPAAGRLSPDGQWITYAVDQQIWVYDLATGTNNRLTFEGTSEDPIWSRDGEFVYFTSERPGTDDEDGFRKRMDNSTAAEQLWRVAGENEISSVSPDGRYLVVREDHPTRSEDLLYVDLEADSLVLQPYLRADWSEFEGVISPNGRWMAYTSDRSGRNEVYVSGFPDPQGLWKVSPGGGWAPEWSHDGRFLYFVGEATQDSVMHAPVRTDGVFSFGPPEALFRWTFDGNGTNSAMDLHPDGDRFLVETTNLAGSGSPIGELVLVVNWFTELERLMGGRR